MFFGVNQNSYEDIKADVPNQTLLRSFKGLAPTWPVMPDGLPSLWSPRPEPVSLFRGDFDATFRSALDTAPPGSMLTTWHEANQSTLTADVARRVHSYMLSFVRRHSDSIHYGIVLTQGAGTEWVIPGADYYGIDLYDIRENTDPGQVLDRFNARMPDGKRLIAETNSSNVIHRPAWFREAYDWLAVRNGLAFLHFWNPDGPLSGPWDGDPATRYALNRIKNDAAR